jgi:hypothetical protein
VTRLDVAGQPFVAQAFSETVSVRRLGLSRKIFQPYLVRPLVSHSSSFPFPAVRRGSSQ